MSKLESEDRVRSTRPRGSSIAIAALLLVLSQPLTFSLSLPDIAILARTCRPLKDPSEKALVKSISVPPQTSTLGAIAAESAEGVRLSSVAAVEAFAKFLERWSAFENEEESDEGTDETDEFEDAEEGSAEDGDSEDATPSPQAHPSTIRSAEATPSLRLRALAIHFYPSQLSSSASLVRIFQFCATTLTHLRITYAEPLLAHDREIYRVLASLPHLTSIALHDVGPRGCTLLRDLKAPLEEVQVDFDDDWVLSVICASLSKHTEPSTLFPALPNGDSSGLPTPAPTPATTPAALAVVPTLPDPVSLLANSMSTLRTLRASNAIIVTVTDKLRYPSVKSLALRLAGVPTVTPLVHAFPSLTELYVYTPFDGCGLRAPPPLLTTAPDDVAPPVSEPSPSNTDDSAHPAASPSSPSSPSSKRRMRPPMPCIHATREANCTSQLYSSFPPLLSVRGFVPGLYALGLTCAVRRLEIGSLTPPSEGAEEARGVRRLLADMMPTSVTIGLGRGWWAPGKMKVREREKTAAKGSPAKVEKGKAEAETARAAKWKGKERDTGRDGLRSIFGGDGADDAGWAGVSELVLRVEEPGRWEHVTVSAVGRYGAARARVRSGKLTFCVRWQRDILAMLLPLANTLTTFVLHWDRTSVPFDRIPLDDDQEEEDGGTPGHAPHSDSARTSRGEAFARRIAEQLPLLRYTFIEILHDEGPNLVPASGKAPQPSPALTLQPWGTRRSERRFFRVDRTEGWLCLDPLSAGVAEKVMAGAGLSFSDRVRYSS